MWSSDRGNPQIDPNFSQSQNIYFHLHHSHKTIKIVKRYEEDLILDNILAGEASAEKGDKSDTVTNS